MFGQSCCALESTQAEQLASVRHHSMSHPSLQQGKATVAHKCHNKHLSSWMFSTAPFDKLKVVAAAALLLDSSWGQVQTARHHVICVHVWLL